MKSRNILKISLLSAMLMLCGSLFSQIQTFEWQGTQRQYLIKMPSVNRETIPVLYFLHGLGDNITRLDNEFHFQQVADEFQWAVVIPQALSQSGATMWNAGLMASSIDDSGFLMALLDSLAVQYPINLDSVFFTGFSMGGFMTHRMAIEHGDRITACAPVSGLITHSMSNLSATPVRMLHIHGTTDPVVGYDGNSQYFGGNLGLSVEAILNYWKNVNHCVAEPVIDTFPDLQNDGLRFVRYTYDGDAELQHIKVIGGNHTWYMSENQYDIGYLTEIHKFFTIDNGNDGVAEPESNSMRIWPNPTSGRFTMEVEAAMDIEVMDMQGRSVAKYALKAGSNPIDLGHLSEGLYFIKGENGAVTKVLLSK
jgi:poly(3-hydroxybutyrate) depolymerase